jgi:hypothetical protein
MMEGYGLMVLKKNVREIEPVALAVQRRGNAGVRALR